ncbi:M42 family metallopeptidase [Mycoplasmopsis citelli]|uniref:M42 family metallopeptidase n=1 Tax=Mycoplasmopsis citelli TaxID=171281 RepID=UPI0021151EB6|nr:M42 family metallopeptidase [Mycoplasmopsis citelli]UUD36466.1 M42 family metallopeptidase [Mycoplasmopsis citelli]
MDKKYTHLFERLNVYMNIEAMSRYEEPVVDELKKGIASDTFEVYRDGFGSVIFHKKSKNPNAPKVMLAAHMDEVGYIVRSVEKNGNLLVSTIGGVWPSAVIGTKATLVVNASGKKFTGVFGHTSIHILEAEKVKQAITEKELFVDFGFMSDQEAFDHGVEVGDRIYISGETVILENNLVGGKAMDNRAGVTAIELIANQVANLDLDVDLYIVGTVQEEVGTRGAKTSVSLINPDVAFAVDTGASHDTTGAIKGTPVLGKGVNLLVKDGGTLGDPKILDLLMHLAKTHNIPAYKYIAMGGGTDASVLQYARGGAKTVSISIPQRYLHSPIGVASLADIQATVDLMVEFIKAYSQEKHEELSYK